MAGFKFDVPYQRKVIQLLFQDYDFLRTSCRLIQPDNFESDTLVWFFRAIRDYFLDYEKRPTKSVLVNEVKKALAKGDLEKSDIKEVKALLAILKNRIKDKDYLVDEVFTFVRHQKLKQAIIESIPLLKQDEFDEIEGLIGEAFKISKQRMGVGVQYFRDYQERTVRQLKDVIPIPTGIAQLDRFIRRGGLCPKELGLWMAAPSVGKSQALVHCGKMALARRKRVVHYTLEMSADMIAERYDMSWSGVRLIDDNADLGKMFKRLGKLGKSFGNSLIIKEFPTGQASVEDLKEHLAVLEDDLDFVPHMLVVDYGDIMAPSRQYKEKRFEVGSVFEDLRALAVQRNIPVWSGKQANREALSKAVVTMKEISESFEPCKIADLIIALCQTAAEKEDDEMRLFFAKNRNQKSGISVPIQTGFDRGQFVVKN